LDLDSNEIARLVYLLLILSSVGGWIIVSAKRDLSRTLQRVLIWILIFFGFFGAYGIWEDISGGFQKDKEYTKISETVFQIKKSANGHFYTSAKINNKNVTFLVDTGATKTLLSLKDAEAIGISIDSLNFTNPIRTANGLSYSASYRVRNFEWFENTLQAVDIQITDGNLFQSLLGMDIIEQSEAFLISGDVLEVSFRKSL